MLTEVVVELEDRIGALADLGELLERSRAAGLPVELAVEAVGAVDVGRAGKRHPVELDRVARPGRADGERALHRDQELVVERQQLHDAVDRPDRDVADLRLGQVGPVPEDPLHGVGQGTFPIAWTKDRQLTELYILQPHSLPLELFAELGAIAGDAVEVEAVMTMPPVEAAADAEIVGLMREALLRADPDATPLPMMITPGTDAKAMARLGIPTYGFAPLRLDADVPFLSLFHGNDERVPVSAIAFGLPVLLWWLGALAVTVSCLEVPSAVNTAHTWPR